jgi:hypothetical protein
MQSSSLSGVFTRHHYDGATPAKSTRRQKILGTIVTLRVLLRSTLGGHLDSCSHCGHQAISYNSCRNRHCPKCQTQARQRWLAAREQEVLPTAYFHVVFCVPHELNVLALENPRCFYNLLFAAASATLLEVAANPNRLGAEIGVITILHTWGQNLLLHPHIHCVVPAGGLAPSHSRWVRQEVISSCPSQSSERSSAASSSRD